MSAASQIRWLPALLLMPVAGCLDTGPFDHPSTDQAFGSCISDDDCEYLQVCSDIPGTCIEPPLDCLSECQLRAGCNTPPHYGDADACVKDWCGASFFGYYRDTYGQACYDAWVGISYCKSQLTCAQIADEQSSGSSTYSPNCQSALDQKNIACGGGA